MIPFAGSPLDRASEKRIDPNWIQSKRQDQSTLILPMRRLEPFLRESEQSGSAVTLGLLRPEIVDSLVRPETICIFLGLDDDRALFALDVSEAADSTKLGPLGFFQEARSAAQNRFDRKTPQSSGKQRP